MSELIVRDMGEPDELFVGTCSHVNESEEIDAQAVRRLAWLEEQVPAGLRVKVALVDGEHAGWLHLIPIELCPWGPEGSELMVLPCMTVLERWQKAGVGEALLVAAEEESLRQERRGLVVPAYDHDFWFMPMSWFVKRGYQEAARDGDSVLLWRKFRSDARPPRFLESRYRFEPVEGKVRVDLFYNDFCQTSGIEAQRVREVAAEFGDKVLLSEHRAEDRGVLACYGVPRALYVNGKSIGWGYEAPREGIREAIEAALGSHLS